MDELYSKSPIYVKDQKFNDLLSLFKAKTRNITNDQISDLYKYSTNPKLNLPAPLTALTLLTLKLRIKNIRKLPMNLWDEWITNTTDFLLQTCLESSQILKKSFFKLCFSFSEFCCEIGINYQAYLRKALWTMLEILSQLGITQEITPIHLSVCKMALMTKKLYDVEHLLTHDFLEVNCNSSVTGTQCVIFFYYLGSIGLILKKYYRASYFFDLAISMPSKCAHAASIESFKKQVLLRLITDGSEYHPPQSAPPRFGSIIRHHSCEAYTKLAAFFVDYLKGRETKEHLFGFLAKNKSIWVSDKNLGLIAKVKESVTKHKIRKLTKVYESLSFKQLTEETEEPEALDILLSMIEDDEINGKIDRQNSTVVFFDREVPVTIQEIQDVCEKLMKYSGHVEDRMKSVSLDPRYLKQLIYIENMTTNR